MIQKDEDVLQEINDAQNNIYKEIQELVQKYDHDSSRFLSQLVASLCGVGVKEMMSLTTQIQYSHARWLFWYAYRYLTKHTIGQIARYTMDVGGVRFTNDTVTKGCAKMSAMIDSDTAWRDKWRIVRHYINLLKNHSAEINEKEQEQKQKVTIVVPDGIDVEIKKK